MAETVDHNWPKKLSDLPGRRVQLTRDTENGWGRMATLTVDAEEDQAIAGALADCIEAFGTFNQAQNARRLARG